MSTASLPPLPWYRHFWPWFVVGLLCTSIAMSLTTAYIAISGSDPEVRRDWQKDAKAVVRTHGPERRALDLGLGASVVSTTAPAELQITLDALPGLAPEHLDVVLAHPTLAGRDVELALDRGSDGLYRGALPREIEGRYELWILGQTPLVEGGGGDPWKLSASIDFRDGQPVRIGSVATGE